jgi:hypothetical protein
VFLLADALALVKMVRGSARKSMVIHNQNIKIVGLASRMTNYVIIRQREHHTKCSKNAEAVRGRRITESPDFPSCTYDENGELL